MKMNFNGTRNEYVLMCNDLLVARTIVFGHPRPVQVAVSEFREYLELGDEYKLLVVVDHKRALRIIDGENN